MGGFAASDPNGWVLPPTINASLSGHALSSAVDSAISKTVFASLERFGIDMSNPSPITSHLPFVSSPTPITLSILAYLLGVYLWYNHIKTAGLKPRTSDPRPLTWLIIAHNLTLCGLSLYMGSGIIYEAWKSGYSVWGNACRDSESNIGFLIYIFYMSKLLEFVDTVIMLLKRNLRQVSLLHVYHHTSISFIWWIVCFRCPSGDAYFSAAINSWIHVLMYAYYLLAAVIGKNEKLRRRFLFWGKYLTVMQMVQFCTFIGQAVYGILNPGIHPKGLDELLLIYSISLLVLFLNFFVRKHFTRSSYKAIKGDKKTE